MTTPRPFETTPLLTPERLAADPDAALAVVPAWVLTRVFVSRGPVTQGSSCGAFVVTLGRTHVKAMTLSPIGFAIACELTRIPGVSIATDSNGAKRPTIYERITLDDAGEDMTTLSRLLFGAGPEEQVKIGRIRSDLRPENLRTIPASKCGKDAREVVLGHIERKAKDWEQSGTMPPHLTAKAYLENLHRLLELNDLEAWGLDPLSSLPIIVDRAGAA